LIGRRLSAEEFTAVLADPGMIDELLFGDLDDEGSEMPEPELDLDKWWHGVHYSLTGTAWEIGPGAGAAVLGGAEMGEDTGYGPPRLLAPEAVREIADGFDAVDLAALRSAYSPKAMVDADIYPSIWADDDADHLLTHVTRLRDFYREAAANGQAVLLAIT
jgi:hypothetical protein